MSMTRLLLLPVALAFWATPAKTQESEVQVLNRRVEQLERRVAELERRLQALDASPQAPRLDAPRPAPGDWKQIGNWRRLRKGMTMDEVSALLGQPDRVDAIGFTTWTYGTVFAGGNVLFDERSQKVTAWSEPHRELH
jgi:hypothetical protein